MEIADTVAIITGASGGIGLATARLFAERHRTLPADPPEHVATKILEAVESEAAEVYADSIRPPA